MGQVSAITSRRGVVRKVVVKRMPHYRAVAIVPPADTGVDVNVFLPAAPMQSSRPRLWLVQ